jgi:hypothetical protein
VNAPPYDFLIDSLLIADGRWAEHQRMRHLRANAVWAVALSVIGSAAALVFVALLPVYVSFPGVIAIAIGWCIWLEGHPIDDALVKCDVASEIVQLCPPAERPPGCRCGARLRRCRPRSAAAADDW